MAATDVRPDQQVTYVYGEDGHERYRKARVQHADGSKTFRFEHFDGSGRLVSGRGGDPILYRLDALRADVLTGDTVYLVEGEKDCDRVRAGGDPATTAGGANDWRSEFAAEFKGATGPLVIVADKDDPGRAAARRIYADLRPVVPTSVLIRIVVAAGDDTINDASDHLDAGFTISQLVDIEPQYDPSPMGPPDEPGDYLQLVRASDVRVTRPVWLWRERIPCNAVTLVAGREGKGKSAFVGDIGARVTRGQLDGDLLGGPADVVYVGTEDDWASVLVPRLTAAGADLTRVHLVKLNRGAGFSVDLDLPELARALEVLDRVGLIIIDPLDAHLGDRVDSHRKSEVQRTLGRLAELAQEYHAAAVGIGHLNKGDGREVLQRVIGSVGFTTSVRAVIGVGDHPDDERDRIAVVAKSNLTASLDVAAVRFRIEGSTISDPAGGEPIPTARIVWLGEELIDANSIVAGLDPQERTERDAAGEFLRSILADGPVPYREVKTAADDDGISRATLHRAAKTVGVNITRDPNTRGRPSTWALPTADGLRPNGVSFQSHTLPSGTKSKVKRNALDDPPERVTSQEVVVWNETPAPVGNRRTSVHFSSATDDWATPQHVFDELNAEFEFTLDPCANAENAKVANYFTRDDDGLAQPWTDETVFMNPPYGRHIGHWMAKAQQEALNGATVVCLVPARPDTGWWHDHAMHADDIRFIRGRLKFGNATNSAPFPSAVVVFRNGRDATKPEKFEP